MPRSTRKPSRDCVSSTQGHYFEAHEALEDAWNAESGKVRDLYRGILQIAVIYLHITRGNYNGAVKVYGRSQKWMQDWPEVCRGIQVGNCAGMRRP